MAQNNTGGDGRRTFLKTATLGAAAAATGTRARAEAAKPGRPLKIG